MTDVNLAAEADGLLSSQLLEWPLARDNYRALEGVRTKAIDVDGHTVKVQFNPARIVSTGAKVDSKTIAERPCFLCDKNRPDEQRAVTLDGYRLLVNPFPIFPRHFTIPAIDHTPQLLGGRGEEMARLAMALKGYTVFYNGALCGASAPDHAHFQAGNSDFLPLHGWLAEAAAKEVFATGDSRVEVPEGLPVNMLVVKSKSAVGAAAMLTRVMEGIAAVMCGDKGAEPMVNVLSWSEGDDVVMAVIPRRRHRPSFYGSGDDELLLSPASVDLAGVLITPVEKDFERVDADIVRELVAETCVDTATIDAIVTNLTAQPVVTVGIMAEERISFNLNGVFEVDGVKTEGAGEAAMNADGSTFSWNGEGSHTKLTFEPASAECTFELEGVTIGVEFHWERKERQRFNGKLTLEAIDGRITAINTVNVEDYLLSVISSEMSATASLELLKAHAVISRSWLLAQIAKNRRIAAGEGDEAGYCSLTETDDERVRWYDREDHTHFDVCADDHCQRYQGVSRATTPEVAEAIAATRGEVLTDSDGNLCDARFSKCCGGVFEQFENCWEPVHHHYLEARRDDEDEENFPDLTIERNAEEWILGRPKAFCNTDDAAVLGQVLNNYDQETTDFYRWSVRLERHELAELVKRRSGVDFGDIVNLVPVARGTSGRLYRLEIIGTKRRMIIGKELEIRKVLSPSHLYSSAFVVERVNPDANGVPEAIVLHGAGWGHGVGLCQIGAAVMGAQGFDYKTILLHYFVDAELTTLY